MTFRKVFVTGANGFVGLALCNRMLADNLCVSGAVRSAKDMDSLPVGVEAINIDSVGSGTDWSSSLNGVDAVVHLAARVHVMKETSTDPIAAFREVNVLGTDRLARSAASAGVKRFVFLSSIGVNGNETHENPFTADDNPQPRNPYSLSKLEAEQVLLRIASETGMEVVIIRAPLVYGTGNPGNFLRLLSLVDRSLPLPLALVNNRRSFIYLGNLVDAIVTCINHPKAANQTFLVSDGQDVSTPDLIKMIAGAMGKKAKLFPCPLSLLKMIGNVAGKSSEVERLVNSLQIDSAKIRRELNWTPPFTMEQGITKTVLSYKF